MEFAPSAERVMLARLGNSVAKMKMNTDQMKWVRWILAPRQREKWGGMKKQAWETRFDRANMNLAEFSGYDGGQNWVLLI